MLVKFGYIVLQYGMPSVTKTIGLFKARIKQIEILEANQQKKEEVHSQALALTLNHSSTSQLEGAVHYTV